MKPVSSTVTHTPDGCTVGRLIAALIKFDPDAVVVFWDDDGNFHNLEVIQRDHNGDVGINWVEPV